MIDKIKFKRTKTKGKVPLVSSIEEGELQLNLEDKKIFTKLGDEVITVGGGSTMAEFTPYTADVLTAKPSKAYTVDISDDISKSVNLPALGLHDWVVVACYKATGSEGVTVTIKPQADAAWSYSNLNDGAHLVIYGNQVVYIQNVNGLLTVTQVCR